MMCRRCRQSAPPGASFCPKCGASLVSPARGRRRAGAKPTFAEQPAIVSEKDRLAEELASKSRALTEALEQQTATAEILQAISTSTRDAQPVFQTITEAAVRLSGALFGSVYRFDGELIHMVAHHNYPPAALEFSRRMFPTPPTRQVFTGRAILERGVVHVPDVAKDPERAQVQELAEVVGFRSALSVPMFREGSPIGAITLWGSTVGSFSESHVALLKTFADQAVIAMENARLFEELEARNLDLTEGLEREGATGEILRVISSSPTDIQPVLEAILDSAKRLCDAEFGAVFRFEGDAFVIAASTMVSSEFAIWLRGHPVRPGPGTPLTRAGIERRPVQVADILADPGFAPPDVYRREGMRTALAVPMLKDDVLLGALTFHRHTVQPFTEQQIALLETFAAQAVIAIENVRLFTELEARNQDLTGALERQTATSEILRVISSSPVDVQPVFDTIVASATRLCNAESAAVYRFENGLAYFAAGYNFSPESLEAYRHRFPRPLAETDHLRRVTDGSVLYIPDMQNDAHTSDAVREDYRLRNARSTVWVPMLREGRAIGVVAVSHRDLAAFPAERVDLLKTFADQAVIAIENVRLFTELQEKNRALTRAHAQVTETLEQQTATSEILSVISSSPTDIQPVFDAIVEHAGQLCRGIHTIAARIDGDMVALAAHNAPSAEARRQLSGYFPRPLDTLVGGMRRALVEGQVAEEPDIDSDPAYPAGPREAAQIWGYRARLIVPMLREGRPIGAIAVGRAQPGAFSGHEIALLQTFADQAVIAIENVRLFTELEARNRDLSEALEQQTATAEILRVISTSPTNLQPVLDTLAASAARFCGSYDGSIFHLDGNTLRLGAHHGPLDSHPVGLEVPVVRGAVMGRSILDREAVHVVDLAAETEEFPEGSAIARRLGFHTLLCVPLLREGVAIGAIGLRRIDVSPFTDKQIALAKTFADQAVIAIENVRLFTELGLRNRDLTQALEQQTATAEVLRVIGSSPTDTQPVFDAIVKSARRLLGGFSAGAYRRVGDEVHVAAYTSTTPSGDAAVRNSYPRPLAGVSGSSEAIRTGNTIVSTDIETDPRIAERVRAAFRVRGFRSVVWVPMLREGAAIGAIGVTRSEPGAFGDEQIALLKTFADQAVIAIENVRLFTELEVRNRDLTEALEQQTATAEILRVISGSPTDVQPVFDAIAKAATALCVAENAGVFLFDGTLIHFAAHHNWTERDLVALREAFPRPPGPGTVTSQAIQTRAVAHATDIAADPTYEMRGFVDEGFHAIMSVPMLRDGDPIGAISVTRREAVPFTESQIALLKTFADQAVIAIQNVRLFKELEARNHDLTEALEQQTATSAILRVISQSQTDVQPVFDTIVQSAVELCDAVMGNLQQFDGERMHLVATHNIPLEALKLEQSQYPRRLDNSRAASRAVLNRAVVNIPDVLEDPDYQSDVTRGGRWRSVLSVPMLREGKSVGVITVARAATGTFAENQVDLLKTFADQAVIAVENVRLFKELQARTAELTRSVEQLTALGEVSRAVSSTLDVETVLDTVVSRARELAGADGAVIYEFDADTEQFHVRSTHGFDAQFVEAIQRIPVRMGEGTPGRAARMREPFQVADIAVPGAYEGGLRSIILGAGYRSALSVPLLREEEVIGTLTLTRRTPGEFSPEIVELLKTFATQSALAIQNARLFREIEDKGRELELASKHKSQFLANMSHELRTPLNAILGYTELLLDGIYGEVPEKARETMGRIERSGRHLLSLINDVLDLSKIEAGQLTLSLADYSLSEIVNTVVTAMEPLAAGKGLALRVALDSGLPLARGDDRRLSQVLLNLVGNAVKFTDAGEVRIEGRVSDGAFLVSVSDTGPGIAAEDQARIFDEFQQVDISNTRKKGGTGLGLSIARRILAMHGGRIWVESAPGQGATFSFTLPVRVERMVQTS